MSRRKPSRLSTLRKLIYGLVVAVLALALAEGALRLFTGPPPPPVRVFKALVDHERWFQESADGVVPLYQPGRPQAFPARWEGPRAAVIGGSSVHLGSRGLMPRQEFPTLAEFEVGFPVLNLGYPGLDSFDLVEILDALTAWDFSALVVYTGHNDFGNAWYQARFGTVSQGLMAHARASLERLRLFTWLVHAFGPHEGHSRAEGDHQQEEVASLEPDRRAAALRYLEDNLRRMAWMAQQRGVPLILITPVSRLDIEPLPSSCDGEQCAETLFQEAVAQQYIDPARTVALLRAARDLDRRPTRAPTAAQEAVRQIAAEYGATLVDAEAALPRAEGLDMPAPWLFDDEIHFNAAGHEAMAALLAPALRAVVEGQGR